MYKRQDQQQAAANNFDQIAYDGGQAAQHRRTERQSKEYSFDYVAGVWKKDHAGFPHNGHNSRIGDLYISRDTLAKTWSTKHTLTEQYNPFHVRHDHLYNAYSNVCDFPCDANYNQDNATCTCNKITTETTKA